MSKTSSKPKRQESTTAEDTVRSGSPVAARLLELTSQLQGYVKSADEAEQWDLAASARTMVNLVQIAECGMEDPAAAGQAADMLQFVEDKLAFITDMDQGAADPRTISEIRQQAYTQWGDVLELIADSDLAELHASPNDDMSAVEDLTVDGDSSRQIDLVLSLLGQTGSQPDIQPEPEECGFVPVTADCQKMPTPPSEWNVPDHLRENAELCEAFLDDANRCLADMESVVLDGGSFANDQERSRSFCRQLHTIKGAAASVGLESLATYLHEVEEWLGHTANIDGGSLDDQLLLSAVDSVRQQIALLENPAGESTATALSASPGNAPATATAMTSSSVVGGEQSVRVRVSQLDRLMDMLAELVVIRNRRESWVNELSRCNDELGRCSNRIRRFADDSLQFAGHGHRGTQRNAGGDAMVLGFEPSGKNALDEVASDVITIAREMSETYQPLSDENAVLSQFIRQFRQELMQLRRLPVAGLFQRLKRAIHDVARLEGKQVEIRLDGEDTGLEQSVQERLFEPLLHMVRNSVSHGIETPAVRATKKKSEQGTVTLQARASASMLTIIVSDDGRGLDYEALRRRGFERGLLAAGSNPNKSQLAKLIFHPGFSTRDTASQVSGRGVGMDVVATTIDRMQGRIEVESTPGAGTSIQLSIPLTTGIEHVMVYRAGGILFALPMRAIQAADLITGTDAIIVPFAKSIGLESDPDSGAKNESSKHTLLLDGRLCLQVDEVIGPDEVVVRPLPEILRRHPLVAGVVLSASGETVLLLNADRTREWCLESPQPADQQPEGLSSDEPQASHGSSSSGDRRTALVVDDSLTARMLLARKLTDRGFQVAEANDGLSALACMRNNQFEYLFTDLDMPRMGGLELLGEVGQLEFSAMNAIVVTSRPKKEIWKRAATNGAVGYLSKPVSGESLDELLDQLKLHQD